MVDYADRLKEAMSDAGVDILALARELDLSRQAVKKVVEGDSSYFKVPNHYAASRFLGVRPEWLALGEEPKRAEARSEQGSVDYRTLALMIIAEHPNSDARELMLQLIELADTKAAQLRQVAAPRAKAHTP